MLSRDSGGRGQVRVFNGVVGQPLPMPDLGVGGGGGQQIGRAAEICADRGVEESEQGRLHLAAGFDATRATVTAMMMMMMMLLVMAVVCKRSDGLGLTVDEDEGSAGWSGGVPWRAKGLRRCLSECEFISEGLRQHCFCNRVHRARATLARDNDRIAAAQRSAAKQHSTPPQPPHE